MPSHPVVLSVNPPMGIEGAICIGSIGAQAGWNWLVIAKDAGLESGFSKSVAQWTVGDVRIPKVPYYIQFVVEWR